MAIGNQGFRLRLAKAVAKVIMGAAFRPIQHNETTQGWEFRTKSRVLTILLYDTRKSQRPICIIDELDKESADEA